MINKKSLSVFIAATLVSTSLTNFLPAMAKPEKAKLTIMMYADADNNLEPYMLNDIQEMKSGYVNDPNLNLVTLVDRNGNYSNDSSTFGENFTDTRLYKIESNSTTRINGGNEFPEITTTSNYEGNMGDANTLKKFIDFTKANYPADKYMLIMSNHGGGAKEELDTLAPDVDKHICSDETNNGDIMYMGQISDVLTKDQSVDVLTFDACLMGNAEVAYQYRPGNGSFEANYMIGSSPNVWGYGFKYDNIFSRIKAGGGTSDELDLTLGGNEKYFDPATVTDEELGALFVEEQRDSTTRVNNQQLSCYDLSKASDVKNSFDAFSRSLSVNHEKSAIESIRGSKTNTSLMHYFKESSETDWIAYPYFDAYDLAKQVSMRATISPETKKAAENVMTSVDNMILYSFGQSKFDGNVDKFQEGKNGLSVFLPDGSRIYNNYNSGIKAPHWQLQKWYNPNHTLDNLKVPYGNLYWCKDGIDNEKYKVGNWFELLDSWFDTSNTSDGGFNAFQW